MNDIFYRYRPSLVPHTLVLWYSGGVDLLTRFFVHKAEFNEQLQRVMACDRELPPVLLDEGDLRTLQCCSHPARTFVAWIRRELSLIHQIPAAGPSLRVATRKRLWRVAKYVRWACGDPELYCETDALYTLFHLSTYRIEQQREFVESALTSVRYCRMLYLGDAVYNASADPVRRRDTFAVTAALSSSSAIS